MHWKDSIAQTVLYGSLGCIVSVLSVVLFLGLLKVVRK